jgi:ubiquinone biosynthesis protein
MLRHFRNTLRLCRIAWILARHDALFPLEEAGISPVVMLGCRILSFRFGQSRERRGIRLTRAMQALGPSFIKLGQSLSTRADLLGEAIVNDLAELRDNVPPFSFTEVKQIVEEDFAQPLSQLFSAFEEKPVAAASIAQVHFAKTAEGREVAVKIVRPKVREEFLRDVELFRWLAEMAEAARPDLKRLRPVEVVKTFAATVQLELDVRFEASGAIELRQNMAQDTDFYVPEIFWPLTSGRVLTMERISGIPLGQIEAVRAAGHDMQRLQKILSESFFKQAFRDGFFHADLHPGNLFVLADGRLAAVDFGIMGRVTAQERLYLAEMFRGFLSEDYARVAELHFEAGYVPAHQSVEQFTMALRAIGQPILTRPLHEISIGRLLAQMFQVTEAFEMETQPQLLLLQKNMVLVEGVGRMLNPEINMWQMAEPLIQDWAREHLGPMAQVKLQLAEWKRIAKSLPETLRKTEKLVMKLETEGLTLHPETVERFLNERRRQHREWLLLGWAALLSLALLLVLGE